MGSSGSSLFFSSVAGQTWLHLRPTPFPIFGVLPPAFHGSFPENCPPIPPIPGVQNIAFLWRISFFDRPSEITYEILDLLVTLLDTLDFSCHTS